MPKSFFLTAILLAAIFVALTLAAPVRAAGKIYYGSRAGMEVDVVSVSGIGTRHAVIKTRHTRANARAFCEQYENDKSEACIQRALKETHLSDQITGDCETGWFTTLYGDRLQFVGENPKRREAGARYIILSKGTPLDGTSASGYGYDLDQFKALCPARVPHPDE